MPKQISSALDAYLKQPTTALATCWKITRTDMRVFAYAELDRDLVIDGITYKSIGGFNKTAIRDSATPDVDDLEVSGWLSDDDITEKDIRNGMFDYAEVEIFVVPWTEPTMGKLKMRYGRFGEVKRAPSGAFIVELRGLVGHLQSRIGNVYAPECRVDVGSKQCGIKIMPDERRSGETYKQGDRVLVPYLTATAYRSPVAVAVVNKDFQTGSLSPWTWSGVGNTISQGTINTPNAPDGYEHFLKIEFPGTGVNQTVNLAQNSVTVEDIDTGVLKIETAVLAAQILWGGLFRVRFTFKKGINGGGVTVDTQDVSLGYIAPPYVWREYVGQVTIPATARSVIIKIDHLTGSRKPNSMPVGGFIIKRMDVLFDNAYETEEKYGYLEFEAQNDGTAAATAPNFNVSQGATVSDGTVTWEAMAPVHSFLSEVTETIELAPIIKAGMLDKPDGWFNWGVVKMLTGECAGAACEVWDWNNTTKELKLVHFFPDQIVAGDKFIVHTGCDKMRSTCRDKFQNVINFRGHPDVPGLGQYFRVAGMGR